jgi:hypothetical protein
MTLFKRDFFINPVLSMTVHAPLKCQYIPLYLSLLNLSLKGLKCILRTGYLFFGVCSICQPAQICALPASCRCLFQNLQVSISKFAGVCFKFCRCLFQILQVSILNFAGVHFKFCRCLFQILQVYISNFAGVHFKFAGYPI